TSCSSSSRGNLIGFGQERIGEKLLRWQAALRTEIGPGGVHHHGRTASIDLHARHVRKVLHHGAVHKACSPGPLTLGSRVREHRYELKTGPVPSGRNVEHIEIPLGAAAPVEGDGAVQV